MIRLWFLYAGEKAIGAYKADMDSEKPVTDNCISNASKHRFKIKLDPEVSQKYSGQPIIVYGISTLELGNHATNNSRTFKIP